MSLTHKECNEIIKKFNTNNCLKGYTKLNKKSKNDLIKKKLPKEFKRAQLKKGKL